MNNTLGSIAYNIGVQRKATILHLCKNFEINIENYILKKTVSKTYLEKDFVEFILKNKIFIKKYEEDYYEKKSIKTISERTNQHKKAIELYLKYYKSNYFIKGELKDSKKLSLRDISSYHIDYVLGGNYDFLKI